MKKQVSPAVLAVVAVVMVIGLGFYLYRSMQPAYYVPSPGAGGRPAASAPSYAKNPAANAEPAGGSPIVPPSGARPGDPRSLKH